MYTPTVIVVIRIQKIRKNHRFIFNRVVRSYFLVYYSHIVGIVINNVKKLENIKYRRRDAYTYKYLCTECWNIVVIIPSRAIYN